MTKDLKKAHIINTKKPEDPIPVLFNPEKYTIEKGNQYAEIGIPGLGSPLLQFVRGNIKTLSMELFFDTYEKREGDKHEARSDVRTAYVDKIMELLEIDSGTHAPPVCIFKWGNLSFTGVLERATRNFTMFLADGTPVRCTMSVTFKEFTTVDIQVKSKPKSSPDRTKIKMLRQGDRLSHIAYKEYDDPGKWRYIAEANKIDNPRLIVPGTEIRIPPLD